jgi:voltage-gated potassium channel
MEANAIFGVLRRGSLLLLAEGLDIFSVPVPGALAGKTIVEARFFELTGCRVVAVRVDGGQARTPEPDDVMASGSELLLIGDRDAARRYVERYG